MDRVELLSQQFASVRRYTRMTLEGISSDDWFRISEGCHTHIAWQVGHIAVGNYGLALAIPRGERPLDPRFIPISFREQFARGSTPNLDPKANPSVEEITAVFDAVHDQVLAELPTFTDELLDEPVGVEHPMFSTKFGSMLWSIQHEYTHAGQISCLYRLHGGEPRF